MLLLILVVHYWFIPLIIICARKCTPPVPRTLLWKLGFDKCMSWSFGADRLQQCNIVKVALDFFTSFLIQTGNTHLGLCIILTGIPLFGFGGEQKTPTPSVLYGRNSTGITRQLIQLHSPHKHHHHGVPFAPTKAKAYIWWISPLWRMCGHPKGLAKGAVAGVYIIQ